MSILVINVGSATCKWKIFTNNAKKVIVHGLEEGPNALKKSLQKITKHAQKIQITRVGHRVVHGGRTFIKPTRITPIIFQKLQKLNALAPLHNPYNLAGIRACQKLFPNVPQIAVFDTAFHSTMPAMTKKYAIPVAWHEKESIERYGFHGTSHAYVSKKAIAILKKKKKTWQRLITCHLGNGCSITAVKNGKSIDTSMGFTPLEGLIMGTRSGDIDPAIIFYLEKKGYTKAKIENTLLHESGLKGLCGTNDMRVIWKNTQKKEEKAQKALTMFTYRIAKYIGAYTMVLGGLDAIVFTGGMGVPAYYIRNALKKYMKKITPQAVVLTIPTDEEQMIAEVIKNR